MSGRRKTVSSRRGSRRIWMQSEDDVPLSLLALIAPKRARGRKKPSPRKKVSRVVAPPPAPPSQTIDLDDSAETTEMINSVNTKIGTFMQSGSFISSDEDETEMIKAKTNKKPSPNSFFISDDSDDDCNIKQPSSTSNFDMSEPSTSAGTSTNPSKDNKPKVLDDDIMMLVDSVLNKTDCNNSETKQSPMKDMKSLEDYRKETEEMLKNASSLLDEIKTGRKIEVEKKKEESSPKLTVGVCPICLESLASRPASVTVCGHIFCKDCIMKTAQSLKKCPTCRKAINTKKIHPIYF